MYLIDEIKHIISFKIRSCFCQIINTTNYIQIIFITFTTPELLINLKYICTSLKITHTTKLTNTYVRITEKQLI